MRLASIAGAATLLLALGGVTNAQQVVIDNIDLTNPRLAAGVLTATEGTVSGTLAGRRFETDIENLVLDLTPACPILHLELAPIHVRLLGLHVDTSAICLDVTANSNGGALGELLCGLAGLPLGDILDGLSTILTESLGDALANATRQSVGGNNGNGNGNGNGGMGNGNGNGNGGGNSICTGQCEILFLSLGPVDLTLLGLEVVLDDCAGGPVQVCVSATRSEGILGSLLCSLAGLQLPNLDLGDITQLVGLAQSLLKDGVLSNADILQLRQLLRQLLNT